jgi:hypothetical protein
MRDVVRDVSRENGAPAAFGEIIFSLMGVA